MRTVWPPAAPPRPRPDRPARRRDRAAAGVDPGLGGRLPLDRVEALLGRQHATGAAAPGDLEGRAPGDVVRALRLGDAVERERRSRRARRVSPGCMTRIASLCQALDAVMPGDQHAERRRGRGSCRRLERGRPLARCQLRPSGPRNSCSRPASSTSEPAITQTASAMRARPRARPCRRISDELRDERDARRSRAPP